MRVNEKVKKLLSILLCLCMLVQNCPVVAFAATTDNLCDHHTEHTAECGYREGSTGSACTHKHSEGCYKIVACKHTHDDTCSSGCSHTCTVENGCVRLELDCHHTHGDCGYAEAVAPQDCTTCQPVLTHAENCGYVAPVAEVTCACVPGEDGTLVHTEGCGYVAGVAEVKCACQPTVTHGGEGCTYAEGKDGAPCNHTHAVKVDSDDSCYKLLCSHSSGGHDDACGYAEAVEAHKCHYECAECAAAAASEEPSEESSEPAPVCDCGTDDPAIHAVSCAVYVAPEDPRCFCTEKCSDPNIWCDVCGFDVTACTGTDTAAVYSDEDYTYDEATNTYTVRTADALYTAISTAETSGTTDNPATIKLAADVEVAGTPNEFGDVEQALLVDNGVITLDLNGQTITSTGEAYYVIQVDNGATLTIDDSSEGNQGKIKAVHTAVQCYNGELVINRGTFEGVDSVSGWNNATIIINGGTFIATQNAILAGNSVLTITGGTFTGGRSALSLTEWGTYSITGGSFSGEKYDIDTCGATRFLSYNEGTGVGPTFPGGLSIWTDEYTGLNLNALLAEYAAYYDANVEKIDLDDSAASYDGDVTVECEHISGENAETNCQGSPCKYCGRYFGDKNLNIHVSDEFTYTPNAEDSSKHDKKYVCCGTVDVTEDHTGGMATCTEQAVCGICKTAYGEVGGHTAEPTYAPNPEDSTKHDATYSCCGATVTEAHNYKTGTPTGACVCGAACPHSNFDSATGNCTDCETSLAIAKIKTGETTTYYLTADELRTAVDINSADADQTITLLADFAVIMGLDFNSPSGVKNTLDLNGHTLTYSKPSERIDVESGELTITGPGSINIFMTSDNEGAKIVVGSGVMLNDTLRSVYGGVLDLTNATIPEAGLNVILYTDDWKSATYNVSDVLLLPEDYYFFVDGKVVSSYSEEITGTVLKHAEHNYTYTDNGDGTHDATCTACGAVVDNEAHSGGTATCTEQAECQHCGASYGDVADHSMGYVADEEANTITYRCGTCDTQTVTFTLVIPTGAVYGTAMAVPHYDCSDKTYQGDYPGITLDGALLKDFVPGAKTYEVVMTWGGKTVSGEYTIAKADVGITAPTPNTLTYTGEAENLISQGEAAGGTMVYSLTENGGYTTTIPKGTNAGDYTVWYYVQGDANHKDSAKDSVDVTIKKATVTVTADAKSKPYGTDNPALTYTASGLIGNDTLTGALETTATKTSNVGEYDITVGSLANSNYTINFVGATLTITKAAAPTIHWPTAAALTYGQKLSDSVLTSEDKNGTFAWRDGSIVPTVTNSGYVVVYTPKDTGNYDYSGVELTKTISVTVSKAAASVATAPTEKELTYTGTAQDLINAGSANGGTMVYSLSENGQYTEDIPTGTNAGEHTVWYYVEGDNNHSDSAKASVVVSIAKAALTVTAKDNTITYGGEPANAGVTYTGFVNRETETVLTGTLAYSYNYAQYGNVGTYKITPAGLISDNYEITYADGALTVAPTWLEIIVDEATKIYGDADPEFTYRVDGLVGSDTIADVMSGKLSREAGENVGVYNITQGTLKCNANYTVSRFYDYTLTIQPREIAKADVTLNGSLIYTGSEQTQPITVTAGITYEVTGHKATDVGTYELTVKGTGNYTGEVKLSWSIKEAASIVTKAPAAKNLIYTGEAQALVNAGTTADGKLFYSLTENGEYTESIPTGTNAGEYTVWYYVVGDDNHADSAEASVKVTIAKAQALITVDTTPITVTYGETVQLPTATTNFGTVVCDKTASDLVNAGTYTITYSVEGTDNYDGDTKIVTVIVEQKAVTEPTVTGTYTYSGREQTAQLTGIENYMSVASGNKGVGAGNYEVEVTLDGNHKWAEGSDGKIPWSIAKAKNEIRVNTDPITVTYGETVKLPTATANFGTVVCDKTAADLENAGTYTVTYTVAGTDNYAGDTKSLTVEVSQKAVAEPTVTDTYVYTGEEQTVTLNGFNSGYMTIVSGHEGTNAGNYEVEVTLDSNHKWAEGSDGKITWTIAKAQAAITVDTAPVTVTYGETVKLPTATTNFGTVVCNKKASDIVNAGTYTVTYTVAGTDNYDGDTKTVTVTIKPKTITEADVKLVGTLTYTGEEQTQEITVTEGMAYTVTGNKATVVGDYTLTVTASGNYTGSVTKQWSIGKVVAVIAKVPKANENLIYIGQTQALVAAGTSGDGKVVYSLTENGEFTETIPVGLDAGEYTVWYYVKGDDNHSDSAKASMKATIAKADPVIGTVGCEMALFDSTAASAVELTRTDVTVGGTLVLTDAELTVGTETYNWKFTPADGENYNIITGTVELTVTADVLETITASGNLEKDRYSYGDTFSIDGMTITATYTSGATEDVTALVEYNKTLSVGQTSVKLTYGGKTCTITGFTVARKQLVIDRMAWDIPENAVYSGTAYTATLTGTLPAGVEATLSGEKATNAGGYTAKAVFSLAEGYSADNYEIVNGGDLTADWTIAKKDIADAQITLGTALTYNGKQQTQNVASVKTDGLTVTYTVSGNTGTDAKGYTLTVTGNGNFEGTATADWSIAKKNISGAAITLGNSLTYNGSAQTQAVTEVKIGDLTVTYDVTANKQVDAGNYTLTVTGNGNFEGSATADWSIAKAKLTITANNNSIPYGDVPAANGVTGTGFVSNESIEDLSGELVYSYSYEQYGNVGTYKITPSGVTSGNYEITFADGTLTVKAKAITVTADAVSKTYGEADPALTYKVEGLVNGDELTGELKRAAGENVGSYDIEQNTLAAGENYNITYTGAKLAIKAKAITAADVKLNGSLTYNGKEQNQAITVTAGITYEVSGNKATKAGDYALTVKGTGNYTGSVTLDWSIAKAKLTITADSKVIYIGETLPMLTYTASGLVGGDKLAKEPVLTTNADADQAGSYTITAANADAGVNYAITYAGGTLTIMDKNTKVETKVGIAALTEVPDGLKNTKFTTVEAIKQELTSRIVAISIGFAKENMVHYDVTLQFSLDGGENWILATEENFPTEGITVVLPYPTGINAEHYDFVVSHMFTVTSQRLGTTAGDVEMPKVTETAGGIQVTLKGLSPVTLAWRATEFDVKIAGTTNGTVSTNVSKATRGTEVTVTVTPKYGYKMATLTVKDASGKSYAVSTDNSGKYYFTMPSAAVTITATFSKISSSTADTTNPKTGDDFNIGVWSSVVFMSSLSLLALLVESKRRRYTK